jgi:flagellar hook protein FlgE
MIQAFYTGVSGVAAHQSAIDITADNLANENTIGFKSYTAEFSALFDDAINADNPSSSVASTVGVGTYVGATKMNLAQGSIFDTDRNTDLAIAGDGWFGVSAQDQTLYTRAGNFTFDNNRDLVNADGMYVLGTIGNNINFDTNTLTEVLDTIPLDAVEKQQKIKLPDNLTAPTQPTKNIQFFGNLGTDDETRAISAEAIDANGDTNKVKLTFTNLQKKPNGGVTWDVTAKVTSKDGETTYSTTDGTVSFDETGALINSTLTQVDNNGTPVAIDLGKDFSGVISIANVPISGSSQSDGALGGELIGYEINANGQVVATFTNGQQSSVAQIAVYHFQNDQGLARVGSTYFQESSNSGKAVFFQDKEGNNVLGTTVLNHKLEASNLPMEVGLTELIIYQRAYDASAKSITTADQMIKRAIDMDA